MDDFCTTQKVYFGHEYSTANLKFAAHVEPDNQDVKKKAEWCKQQREKQPPEPTTPSTIGNYYSCIAKKPQLQNLNNRRNATIQITISTIVSRPNKSISNFTRRGEALQSLHEGDDEGGSEARREGRGRRRDHGIRAEGEGQLQGMKGNMSCPVHKENPVI